MAARPIIFSHAHCIDGLAAAWALWTVFGYTADYVFCKYNTDDHKKIDVTDRDVYFVDFSAPRADLLAMAVKANSVTVADHHKTAQADLNNESQWAPDNLRLIFDMNKSGARLAWDLATELAAKEGFAARDGDAPALINYVEDRDLWNWKLPYSHEVSAYIGASGRTIEDFEKLATLLRDHFDTAISAGTAILADHKQRVGANVKRLQLIHDEKKRAVLFGNVTEFGSETGNDALLEFPEIDYTATYFDTYSVDGGVRVFSLRARKGGVDVSAIAKANGGGGHAAAAGFSVKFKDIAGLPWKVEA